MTERSREESEEPRGEGGAERREMTERSREEREEPRGER